MIVTSQVSAGTKSSLLCTVPPGPCMVVVSNAGTAAVYVGAGSAVSTGNGLPVPSGQSVAFAGYQGDGGTALQVVSTVASQTVGYLISYAAGGTG